MTSQIKTKPNNQECRCVPATIFAIVGTIFIVFVMGIKSISLTEQQLWDFCHNQNWTGIHNLSGDFVVTVNCSEYKRIILTHNYSCSHEYEFWSPKIPCRYFYAWECEIFNRENKDKGLVCVV